MSCVYTEWAAELLEEVREGHLRWVVRRLETHQPGRLRWRPSEEEEAVWVTRDPKSQPPQWAMTRRQDQCAELCRMAMRRQNRYMAPDGWEAGDLVASLKTSVYGKMTAENVLLFPIAMMQTKDKAESPQGDRLRLL